MSSGKIVLPTSVPPQGTPEFDVFVQMALKNPKGPESILLDAAMDRAKQEYAEKIQKMLAQMQELVPGQVFRDIERFHKKFNLAPTNESGHALPSELLKFRVKFMLEELTEYCDAVGLNLSGESTGTEFDPELALDSLIDLVYVAVGTAYMHRFPFNEGWSRVQGANMAKVRAISAADSKRGSTYDVVKPPGWTPPSHKDLLGYSCSGCGARSLKNKIGESHADGSCEGLFR